MLCDKINKEDIEVKFIERNGKGDIVWDTTAPFGPGDVHHQVAIIFETPRYFNGSITSERKVFVQLVRPSDGEKSDLVPFTIRPDHQPG